MPPLEGEEEEEGADEDIVPTSSEGWRNNATKTSHVKKLFGLVGDLALQKQQPIENDPLLNEPDPTQDLSAWLNWRIQNLPVCGHPVLTERGAYLGRYATICGATARSAC